MTGPGHDLGPADERGRRPDAAGQDHDDVTGTVQPDGDHPTDVLPRRRPPLSEQQTTALPRRPLGPPAPSNVPGASPYDRQRYPVPPPGAGYPPPPAPPGHLPPAPAGHPQGYSPRPTYPPLPGQQPDPRAYAGPDPAFPDDGYPATPGPVGKGPPPRGAHLPPYSEPLGTPTAGEEPPPGLGGRTPRKITVTRVAALRSRELTLRGVDLFHRAATADGADRSGLAHLTYAQMANYACDAALAVALANTLFLVRPEEGAGRVLLYLLITVAPFAFVAPLIGPFLDRLQTGRRLALAVSMAGRGLLAIPMIFMFSGEDASWVLYPCALGSLVLSKSFGVLKASLTPRVLPAEITLVATNSRLTVFGLIAGGVAGAVAGGLTWLFGSPGALVFTALLGFGGAFLCLKIPAWVESTEGEVPVHLSPVPTRNAPTELTVAVRVTLWANSSIRIETGFLAMFIAFVVMKEYAAESGFYKLMLLGLVGGAAGLGGFVGNALGAKLPLRSPELISMIGLVVTLVGTLMAAVLPGLAMAAVVGFVGSTSSSLAKVCLDSVIQRDLPEVSRASAFGRSETALQLGWVFGGVVGLLIGGLLTLSHDPVYIIGFGTATALLTLGLIQTWLARSRRSLIPPVTMPWRRAGSRAGKGSRRADGGTTTAIPQPLREPDGTYTTRLSYGDAADGADTPDVTPRRRDPRPAGSPRTDLPNSYRSDPTTPMPTARTPRRRPRRNRREEPRT